MAEQENSKERSKENRKVTHTTHTRTPNKEMYVTWSHTYTMDKDENGLKWDIKVEKPR